LNGILQCIKTTLKPFRINIVSIILCPGIHAPELTEGFWNAIQQVKSPNLATTELPNPYIVPEAERWAFSPVHTLQFFHQMLPISEPLVLIGFSAGCVGMVGAAWTWQQQGGTILALVALDGWGVPLYGTFPIYRLSHDVFTHWSSQALGMGQDPFYAEPGVAHLELWRSPDQSWGWWCKDGQRQWTNAAIVVRQILPF
jgi:hypothetical protein